MAGQQPLAIENNNFPHQFVVPFNATDGGTGTAWVIGFVAPCDCWLDRAAVRWETASASTSGSAATGHFAKVADGSAIVNDSTATALTTEDEIDFEGTAATYVEVEGLSTANYLAKGDAVFIAFGDAPTNDLANVQGYLVISTIRH